MNSKSNYIGSRAHLESLMLAYVATAKADSQSIDISDEQIGRQLVQSLPEYLSLLVELVSPEALLDKSLIRQSIDSLVNNNSIEETLMYTYLFYIYMMVKDSTGHPLEMGIIRQNIISVIPVFEVAVEKSSLKPEVFESNAAMLMSIADERDDMLDALKILASGYEKYSK